MDNPILRDHTFGHGGKVEVERQPKQATQKEVPPRLWSPSPSSWWRWLRRWRRRRGLRPYGRRSGWAALAATGSGVDHDARRVIPPDTGASTNLARACFRGLHDAGLQLGFRPVESGCGRRVRCLSPGGNQNWRGSGATAWRPRTSGSRCPTALVRNQVTQLAGDWRGSPIRQKWLSLGGESALGLVSAVETYWPGGGRATDFCGGVSTIAWRDDLGARAVVGAIHGNFTPTDVRHRTSGGASCHSR